MQKSTFINNIKKEIEELKEIFAVFEAQNHLTPEEADRFIQHTETLYRNLAVYAEMVKPDSVSSGLDVHLKIMKAVEKKDEVKMEIESSKEKVEKNEGVVKTEIPNLFTDDIKVEKKEEGIPKVELKNTESALSTKKVEIGVNDKYRIINELFEQEQKEFNVAVEQLNVTESWEEAEVYLDSLGEIYEWKIDNELVKTLYSLVQKRFA